MRPNFSFDDRVAQRYNRQREHPSTVSEQIGTAIRRILPSVDKHPLVLEIGVGTGRIAWPVVDAGCQVVGIDLSSNMLGEVYEKRPFDPATRLYLAQTDMHHLPFVSRSFDAALFVHVLHLAKDWQQVLRETTRVLKPGGAFIQGSDWLDPNSVLGRFRDELRQRVLDMAPNMMPPAAGVSLDETLMALGGETQTEVIAAEWTVYVSPAERLEAIATKTDNESWFLPPAMFEEALRQMTEWASETWMDLEAKQPVTRRFMLKISIGAWQNR